MRPLVQYDLDEPPAAALAAPQTNPRRPPAKKRKRNYHNPSGPQKAPVQHWDDPGSTAVGVVYDEQENSALAGDVEEGEEVGDKEQEEEEEEESRPLTHDEIWDDSALIDAWNSAEAEYHAYHGTSKAWKSESVKRSPLWYNKPYTAPIPKPGPGKSQPRNAPAVPVQEGGELEPDTAPLDFDTFVPTHDPSLGVPSDVTPNPATNASFFVLPPSTTMVSRDEAFNNALSSMYWGGYWTAVYHCQSQASTKNNNAQAEATENGVEADEDEDEDLVPAQQ